MVSLATLQGVQAWNDSGSGGFITTEWQAQC